jgi:hypothetical protein
VSLRRWPHRSCGPCLYSPGSRALTLISLAGAAQTVVSPIAAVTKPEMRILGPRSLSLCGRAVAFNKTITVAGIPTRSAGKNQDNISAVQAYGQRMTASVSRWLGGESVVAKGAFVDSCHRHCGCSTGITADSDGMNPKQAFASWYLVHGKKSLDLYDSNYPRFDGFPLLFCRCSCPL